MQSASREIEFERRVRVDGCFNFRDLGAYLTRSGCALRTGRLFRADGPSSVGPVGASALQALQLATIIDLRTAAEVERQGRFGEHAPEAVEYHLPLTEVLPGSDELAKWADPRVVADHYRELLTSGHDAICESLAILTDPAAYPALIHCSAGKDRTGVLSALILGMLGVPDETIVDDYAMSGPAMLSFVEHLLETYPEAADEITRQAPALSAADPKTMQWFIADVRAEYGSLQGFVEQLGMQSAIPYTRSSLLAA